MKLSDYAEFVAGCNSDLYLPENIDPRLLRSALSASVAVGTTIDHAKRELVYKKQSIEKRQKFLQTLVALNSLALSHDASHVPAEDKTKVHGLIGIVGEGGEMAEILLNSIDGGEFDPIHVKEELGDLLWYIQLTCNAFGFTLDDVIDANVKKLLTRYKGTKWTPESCENRDYSAERAAMTAA